MSVGLGTLTEHDDVPAIDLSSENYDGDYLRIDQGDQRVEMTRRQLQDFILLTERWADH